MIGPARRAGHRVALLLLTMLALAWSGAVWVGAPTAYGASGPKSWACDAKTLGLEKVVVQLAPVEKNERFSDGHRITNEPDARGKWVPVILVHGWTSRSTHPKADGHTGAFSGPIDLSPDKFSRVDGGHTLVGQIQDIPGAALFTYDYHPYSGRWVTDDHLGPGLGKVIDCLARASGEKVIVVGHSMGGLIARYAASTPPGGGAKDRSAEISQIVTLGTPNTGSVLAAVVGGVIDKVPGQVGAVIRLLLAGCGAWTTADMDASVCSIVPFVGAFQGQAGRALQAGSKELAALPKVPKAIPVDALAGSTRFTVPRLGWFEWPWSTNEVPVGDIIVTESSAQAGAAERREITCRYQLNPVRSKTDEWGLKLHVIGRNDVADAPLGAASGPCVHTSLMRTQELANEIAGVINEDISDRYVSRADLLSAPVPALRGNHAGTLVKGVLPKTGNGFVRLERTGGAGPALGDLNGDGRGDAVAVVTSTSGAGGSDSTVFAYTKRHGQLNRVATFDPARQRSDTYHAYVTGMIIENASVKIRWDTTVSGSGPGPSMAATLRLDGSRFVVSDLREDDGSSAGALPAYPATEASGFAMQEFLDANHIKVITPPIDTGCERLAVYGADLTAGNVDFVHAWSLCDGDAVQDFFVIRNRRLVTKDWFVLENGMGNASGWKSFITPYGHRRPVVFDITPGDTTYYLTPVP